MKLLTQGGQSGHQDFRKIWEWCLRTTVDSIGGGVFEVTKNEHLVFSKKQEGRFPEIDEVFDLLGKPV